MRRWTIINTQGTGSAMLHMLFRNTTFASLANITNANVGGT